MEKGVSVERVNVAMKNTGLDLFRKCLCQERSGPMYTKNSMAMLVSQQGQKPEIHDSRSIQDKEWRQCCGFSARTEILGEKSDVEISYQWLERDLGSKRVIRGKMDPIQKIMRKDPVETEWLGVIALSVSKEGSGVVDQKRRGLS